MGKYGKAAVDATELVSNGHVVTAPEAWHTAVRRHFPDRIQSQKKGCPRGAYLGLCEAGVVRGIQPGSYTSSRLNKKYALTALKLLHHDPSLCERPKDLWQHSIGAQNKVENGQMDVVLTLWRHGLIRYGLADASLDPGT